MSAGQLVVQRTEKAVPAGPKQDVFVEDLYRLHCLDVERWVRRLGGPSCDAADLMHDVFSVVHRNIGSYRGDGSLKSWLFGITAKVVAGHRRKHRWLSLFVVPDLINDVADSTSEHEASLENSCREKRLYASLDKLSEKLRTAVIMFEIDELSAADIARLTGVSEATVWVRVHRGRKKLLEFLKADEEGSRADD